MRRSQLLFSIWRGHVLLSVPSGPARVGPLRASYSLYRGPDFVKSGHNLCAAQTRISIRPKTHEHKAMKMNFNATAVQLLPKSAPLSFSTWIRRSNTTSAFHALWRFLKRPEKNDSITKGFVYNIKATIWRSMDQGKGQLSCDFSTVKALTSNFLLQLFFCLLLEWHDPFFTDEGIRWFRRNVFKACFFGGRCSEFSWRLSGRARRKRKATWVWSPQRRQIFN